ncbi:hypothetical protein TP38_08495 [Xanthomonas citri pv. citri]|nr:hypothetical protein TP38_08495 [Xanthomonas citri pv. citri]
MHVPAAPERPAPVLRARFAPAECARVPAPAAGLALAGPPAAVPDAPARRWPPGPAPARRGHAGWKGRKTTCPHLRIRPMSEAQRPAAVSARLGSAAPVPPAVPGGCPRCW